MISFNVEEIMNLVALAANVDGLINLRVDTGDIYLFRTFINYCLIRGSESMTWKYKSAPLLFRIYLQSQMKLYVFYY